MSTSELENDDFRCPPFLAYYLAGVLHGKKWPGLDGVVSRTGLPRRTVIRIGSQTSWRYVKRGVQSAFLQGCGINMRNIGNVRRYFAKQQQNQRPFSHLNDRLYKVFQARCQAWQRQQAERKK